MTENKYINPQSLDLEFLKQTGLKELEKLSTGTWTDFNTHDPGITILEHLSYAALDLNYRTSFPVEDILANEGNTSPILHTARNVMHNTALSLDDYRRLMINCDGVINAHIMPIDSPEPKIYLYKKDIVPGDDTPADYTDKLSHIAPVEQQEKAEILKLKGLYKVLLELEHHDTYKDLNSNRLSQTFSSQTTNEIDKKIDKVFEIEFPSWDANIDWNNLDEINDNIKCISWFVGEDKLHCKVSSVALRHKIENFHEKLETAHDVKFEENSNSPIVQLSQKLLHVLGQIPVAPAQIDFVYDEMLFFLNEGKGLNYIELLQSKLKKYPGTLQDIADAFNTSFHDQLSRTVYYRGRVNIAHSIKDEVARVLHQHRNLCENFVSFESVKIEEVAVYADVEVGTDVDTNELLADIYLQLHHFINPPVKFKSRTQLQELGVPVDEIFDGPLLDRGFLPLNELPQRKNILFLSDLMNILMDIKGVRAVKYLGAITHPDGVLLQREGRSSLKLNPENNFITRLTINKSTISFFKEGFPLQVSKKEAREIYDQKIGYQKSSDETQRNSDIEINTGRDRELAKYTSIQNDFTLNYGIGKAGLPKSATDLRKAQARQLKAYLLFFEQILANYHGQLDNIKNIFSPEYWPDNENLKTYFTQSLLSENIDIPNIGELYTTETSTIIENENKEKYELTRKDRFLNHFLAQIGFNVDNHAYLAVNNKKDVELEDSKDEVQSADSENPDNTIAPENPAQDDVSDNQNNNSNTPTQTNIIETRRLNSKINLLKLFPDISSKRAMGIDIYNQVQSNDGNISGLKKLVCQVLNINTAEIKDGYANAADNDLEEGFYLLEHMLLRPVSVTDPNGNYMEISHLRTFTNPRIEEGPWETDPYSSIISVVLPGWIGRFAEEEFRGYFERTMNNESPAHISILFYWLGKSDLEKFEEAYLPFIKGFLTKDSNPYELALLRNQVVDVFNDVLLKSSNFTPSEANNLPRLPIPIRPIDWTVQDFGKEKSQWIYGTGNTIRQVSYMGTKNRANYGEGSIALFNQPLFPDVEKIEVEVIMDNHPYSEAGICFMHKSNNDYRLFACKNKEYGETLMSTTVTNGILRPSFMPVKNIAGQTVTFSFEIYKDEGLKLSLSKPGATTKSMMIPEIKDWGNTRFGLYTRYSCNTVFQKLELSTNRGANFLPLRGIGNMFLGIEKDRIRDTFHPKGETSVTMEEIQNDTALNLAYRNYIALTQQFGQGAKLSYGGLSLQFNTDSSYNGLLYYYDDETEFVHLKRIISSTDSNGSLKYYQHTVFSKPVYSAYKKEMQLIATKMEDTIEYAFILKNIKIFSYQLKDGVEDWKNISAAYFAETGKGEFMNQSWKTNL